MKYVYHHILTKSIGQKKGKGFYFIYEFCLELSEPPDMVLIDLWSLEEQQISGLLCLLFSP